MAMVATVSQPLNISDPDGEVNNWINLDLPASAVDRESLREPLAALTPGMRHSEVATQEEKATFSLSLKGPLSPLCHPRVCLGGRVDSV